MLTENHQDVRGTFLIAALGGEARDRQVSLAIAFRMQR
jgi:hypothetical protein